ncbi:MAG: hypothetical protein ABJ308_04815 [Halieaceae bacterium]
MGSLFLLAAMDLASAPLFESEEPLQAELRGPFKSLLADEGRNWQVFQLTSGEHSHAVRLRPGGKSRRKVCKFFPLRMNLTVDPGSESATTASVFPDWELLRVVTHCNESPRSQDNVIEEYIAYRIMNLLTEFSYRVRLMQINYVDTESVGRSLSRYAFAIEPEQELARRVGGKVLSINGLPKRRLNEEQAAYVYIFQYLIANTDWSLVTADGADQCCHNGQLIDFDSEIFYIPYDFDLSGLVNPHYASPDPSLRIERVTQRLYRGYCGPPAALEKPLARITAQREAILELYRQTPGLSNKERNKGIKFLEGFFRKAQNPEKLLSKFGYRCIK